MKITNDLNNTDILSNLNKEDDKTSVLTSIFSINTIDTENSSNNFTNDFEFFFNEEEIQAIDYLYNIMPNLHLNNFDISDLKNIKNEIKLNQNITSAVKNKIINFLDLVKVYDKSFTVKLPPNYNFKSSTKHEFINNVSHSKSKVENLKISSSSQNKIEKKNEQNLHKSKDINKNIDRILKPENEMKNQQKLDFNHKNENFVKKVVRNKHPNKLYQDISSNFASKKMVLTSSIEKNLADNNYNYLNNQINADLKKPKISEIELNNKSLNIQGTNENNSKGNHFSQQNNSSFSNAGLNSVLEGLLETLDLTKKGWSSKLASRIENALEKGNEELEFNLKPKNLGKLKVSISLKNGIGNVKIITENTFVTSALNQNENHLQKLFNDQGIELEFLAQDEKQSFNSKNDQNKGSENKDQKKFLKIENKLEKTNSEINSKDDVSSEHIINVIA